MQYKVLFIEKSGRINWKDVDTIDDCIALAKAKEQEVDVYSNMTGCYMVTIEVLK